MQKSINFLCRKFEFDKNSYLTGSYSSYQQSQPNTALKNLSSWKNVLRSISFGDDWEWRVSIAVLFPFRDVAYMAFYNVINYISHIAFLFSWNSIRKHRFWSLNFLLRKHFYSLPHFISNFLSNMQSTIHTYIHILIMIELMRYFHQHVDQNFWWLSSFN